MEFFKGLRMVLNSFRRNQSFQAERIIDSFFGRQPLHFLQVKFSGEGFLQVVQELLVIFLLEQCTFLQLVVRVFMVFSREAGLETVSMHFWDVADLLHK